ncbi:hypothetical protein P5673_027055 [Acropora cervicornis]|uniref:DDE Tnp4 domain-containing protein n=1 Tax=Acropora cervicornis TaxID=6130 RepID=A0AAD9UW05_ACRCE|nr:hypothetical protein P5673_027055 [Acropora cervicornis]
MVLNYKPSLRCALALQSQLYSDYKSSTTLKCLDHWLLFVSELFTGYISDKQLTEQSGFYDLLRTLKSIGYIQDNDATMADKGFTIQTEIENLGVSLNLPPFASAGKQMLLAASNMTSKIAKHRVHIERLIKKKTKIAQKLPEHLDQKITSFVIKGRRKDNYELVNIGNMDETPVWFDMP